MQTNGALTTETNSVVGELGDASEQLPDHISAAQSLAPNGPALGQVQQQQSSESPGHHHSQTPTQPSAITSSMTKPGTATTQTPGSNIPHQMSASHHFVGGSGHGNYRPRHGQPYYNQQRMQQYHQHQQNKYTKGDSESNVNHVLLITVINPHYPITCDLIHQICNLYGKVNRIVIFKKNGIQAMVEFDNLDSAKRAKSMLNGCDIYSGCCTLRVEYAKPTRLNVHKNDNESFDYTNPNLGNGSGGESESGSGHNDQQQQQQHQHHHHHGHHLQPNVHHQGYHSGSHHPPRGGGNRRGGDSNVNEGPNGASNHHPYHHSPQSHMPNNSHLKQTAPPTSVGHVGGPSAYGMGQSSMDQAGSADSFQQDGGFNTSRNGPPSNYVNVDPFMQSHRSSHGLHGNLYPRQDPHSTHQHHQTHHHHPRGGIGNAGGDPNHHHHHHHHQHHNSFQPTNALMAGHPNMAPQGTVMMVYGLSPGVNCDRLFNLFCLYGNVVRVKFLRTKEGCAMVQMGDVIAVERCITSLNKITLFGNELQISYSKQAFLHDVLQPFSLPDGSPSFKDFMGNKNNRFKNPEVASKNRILPPSPILHFFNAPFGITEDELLTLFKETTGHEPVSIKLFLPKEEGSHFDGRIVSVMGSRSSPIRSPSSLLCEHHHHEYWYNHFYQSKFANL